MNYFRIYADEHGETHIEDIEVAMVKQVGEGQLSRSLRAGRVAFGHTGPHEFSDWHCTLRRQFVVTLAGEIEYRVSDGTTRRAGPGSVMLVDDANSKGHQSRMLGDADRLSMYVTLEDDPPAAS